MNPVHGGVGREARHRSTHLERGFRRDEVGVDFGTPFPLASASPTFSSISSARRNPGVTATAMMSGTFCHSICPAMTSAMWMAPIFAKLYERGPRT